MATKNSNANLSGARRVKQDEFYTQLADIEHELRHYKAQFKDKVVYCNCDDPRVSNFFHYFSYNFEKLGLKKLITTCYKSQKADLFTLNDSEEAIYLEYEGDKNGNNVPDPKEIGIKPLKGDGDFRSAESIELLKQPLGPVRAQPQMAQVGVGRRNRHPVVVDNGPVREGVAQLDSQRFHWDSPPWCGSQIAMSRTLCRSTDNSPDHRPQKRH
jgi:Adenine-specific methyltransferase EcoRI